VSIEVPFLQDGEIEQEADGLLTEYCREQNKVMTEPPVPIEDLVELHLQLVFEFKDLHQELGFPDIHGAIWVNERRIAIDTQLDPHLFPAKRGRYHFTLAHETGHWRLHRKYFIKRAERHLFDGAAPPPDFIGRSGNKNRVEVQANQFAACLLMPRQLIRQEWERLHGDLTSLYLDEVVDKRQEMLKSEVVRRGSVKPGTDGENDMLLEHLSRPMAERFHVSAEAMRYRLAACGWLGTKRPATLF